jgi:hypothetical protein
LGVMSGPSPRSWPSTGLIPPNMSGGRHHVDNGGGGGMYVEEIPLLSLVEGQIRCLQLPETMEGGVATSEVIRYSSPKVTMEVGPAMGVVGDSGQGRREGVH